MKDRLFEEDSRKQFEFDEQVAAVFDDMIERSVPFYRQSLELMAELILMKLKPGSVVLDLGSSTGSLLIEVARRCRVDAQFIGVDNAAAMVELSRKKAKAFGADVEFVCKDLLEYEFPKADVIISNYTLQFIRPLRRLDAVRKIFEALKDKGVYICSEKILMEDSRLNRDIIDIYHKYKERQGYSKTEIMRKREALENVLVPYTLQENRAMFLDAGFKRVDTIFQWGNFATMVISR